MLDQAAACLAALDKSEKPGDVWTPSTLFGDTLIERSKHMPVSPSTLWTAKFPRFGNVLSSRF
jgi:hypothetical protein